MIFAIKYIDLRQNYQIFKESSKHLFLRKIINCKQQIFPKISQNCKFYLNKSITIFRIELFQDFQFI